MNEKTILTFNKAGLLTTIQDVGRYAYLEYGVSPSGAMDQLAAQMANWLVENPFDTPVLELTLLGPSITFGGQCQIAITGANLSPTINGAAVSMYETLTLKKNDYLTFGKVKNGCRAYIAVRGKWLVKRWLGSASADKQVSLTPLSKIKKDTSILIENLPSIKKKSLLEKQPIYNSNSFIRVIAGPEFDTFSTFAIADFFSKEYRISPQSNRMGYRLEGTLRDFNPSKEIISSGILPGTIQITNSGQPILLMMDAQTTGGYHRIANVISADMPKVAQLKPSEAMRFTIVTLEEAQEYLKEMKALF